MGIVQSSNRAIRGHTSRTLLNLDPVLTEDFHAEWTRMQIGEDGSGAMCSTLGDLTRCCL